MHTRSSIRLALCAGMLASIGGGIGAQDAIVPVDHATIGDALRNAEDTNGDGWVEILVQAGTYHETLRIRRSKVRLMGEDAASTLIVGNGRDDVVRAAPREGEYPLQQVTVFNFTISGGGSGGEGVEFSRVSEGSISDCVVTGCHEGILVQDSSGIGVFDNLVHGNRGTGIRISRSVGPFLIDNVVLENGGQGIHYQQVSEALPGFDTRFEFNEASGNRENGLLMVETDGFVVRNCVLEGNHESGIRLKQTLALQLLENSSLNNGADGLRMEWTQGSLVLDNAFLDNGGFGIRLREGTGDDFSEDPGLQLPVGTNEVAGNHAGNASPEAHTVDFTACPVGPMPETFFEADGVVFRAEELFVGFVQGDEALVTDFEGRFSRPVIALSLEIAPGFLGTFEYRLTAFDGDGDPVAGLIVTHSQPPDSGYFELDLGSLPEPARSFRIETSYASGAGVSSIRYVMK